MLMVLPTLASALIAMSCVSGEKAAQPSERVMVLKSRTCASRTVEALPQLQAWLNNGASVLLTDPWIGLVGAIERAHAEPGPHLIEVPR